MGVTQIIWTTTGVTTPRIQARIPTAPKAAAASTPRATGDAMMTIRDVADACQLSDTAVRRAVYEGELQAVKLRSRLRITKADYDAWIASQRQPPHRAPTPPRPTARQPRQPPAGSFRALARADDQARAL